MNFYICSTPYHLFVSLCHLYFYREKAIFYLTTHDEKSESIFRAIESRLANVDFVEDVVIRKRSKIRERFRLEEIKDMIEYQKIKKVLNASYVYIFPWNPYSLYTISNFLYRKAEKVVLVEDGSTMYAFPKPNKLQQMIKRYIYGVSTDFHKDKKLTKILVQFPEKYPSHLKEKIEQLDMGILMANLGQNEKETIMKVFLSEQDIVTISEISIKNTVIILTQPLSEDGFTSEEEKRKLYKDIIDEYKKEFNIILKRHPRERTIYSFENVTELDGMFPSEIFTMLDIKFHKAIGICTSAVNLMNADEKINTDENFLKRRRNND